MNRTRILTTALLLAFGLLLAACLESGAPAARQNLVKITVSVDFNGESENIIETIELPSGSTAFNAFNKTLSLKYREFLQGVYVTTVNGVREDASKDKFWQYYVNNEYAPVGVTQFVLNEDSELEFRYENAKLK